MRSPSAGSFCVLSPFRAVRAGFSLAVIIAAVAGANEFGQPVVRGFPPGRSKINHLCQAIAQGADGCIYVGNDVLIHFYDGLSWRAVDGVPSEAAGVRRFATTADGTIYAGGAGLIGWLRTTGERKEFVSLAEKLPPAARDFDDIFDALAVGDTVFFSTADKLLLWRDGRFTVLPCPAPPNSKGARLHRVGDDVYVSVLGQPLRRLVREQFIDVADDPVLRENQIVRIDAKPDGSLVLLTGERGFFRLDGARVAALPLEANRWLEGKKIIRALRLPDGSLAVAFSPVSGDGGMRFDPAGRYVGPLDERSGLYVKTLRDIFPDKEGGLWLGTEAGLMRLNWPSGVSVFNAVNGLGQGAVMDIARHAGTLYAATMEGVYRLVASDEKGQVAQFERELNQRAYALLSHPAGLLALGYADLFAQTPAGFVSAAKVAPGGGSLRRSTRNPNRVWIATTQGLYSMQHTVQGWRDEGRLTGLDESIQSLTEAADGSLIVSTNRSELLRVTFGGEEISSPRLTRLEAEAGIPAGFTRVRVAGWAGEFVYLFNNAAAPLRFDFARQRFTALLTKRAWLANIAEVGSSARSNQAGVPEALWLANLDAIVREPLSDAPTQRLPQIVLANSGTVSRLHEELGPDGAVLWVAGAKGLVRVEVARAFPPPVPYTAQLYARGVSEGQRLAPEHEPFSFSFIAPRFALRDAVTFQTRLVGYDTDWSAGSIETTRAFARLPEGNYRFEVRARDSDGQLSVPADMSFAVLSPWWRTPWAFLAYLAGGFGVVAGLVRWRTRALRRHAARLEGIVAERTAELARKNTELIRLNQLELDEKISARLAEEKARLEMLRYQLNPHFLFNTLAAISSSLPEGLSTTRSMVERLAEFCRLTLHRGGDQDWTTLGEEMQLLRAYLEIEQSRWGDLLEVAIDCEPALATERLPHFLLLPLVENALKYGRATSRDRVGLRLTARRRDDGWLLITVANTGAWIDPADKKKVASLGIGLENLRERLQRHYPRKHQFESSHADGWVSVTLHLLA